MSRRRFRSHPTLFIFTTVFLLSFMCFLGPVFQDYQCTIYHAPVQENILAQEMTSLWNFTSYDEIHSSPAVGDLIGDEELEIVFGTNNQYLVMLNARTGGLIWSQPTEGRASSPAIADIDNDNDLDILVGSGQTGSGYLYAITGSGNQLWSFSMSGGVYSTPAVADIDSDGRPEVVFGCYNSFIYALNGEDGSICWTFETIATSHPTSSPAIGDITGTGRLDVVIGAQRGLIALNGETGEELWDVWRSYDSKSSPILADVNNDGLLEVLIGDDNDFLSCYMGHNGTAIWGFRTDHIVRSSPAIGDINNDLTLDVVVGSGDGTVYAVRADTGESIWNTTIGGIIDSGTVLADFNGDNSLDVAIGCYGAESLVILNGRDGSLLWTFPLPGGTFSSPVIADFDGNGGNDLAIGCNDGNLYAFSFDADCKRVYWQGLGGSDGFSSRRNLHDSDSDMDFLSTYTETVIGTLSDNPDSDSDTLSDFSEFVVYGTDPLKQDSESDGTPDAWEVYYSLDPLSNDSFTDPDFDTLLNLEEYGLGTSPRNNDSDFDALDDASEVYVYFTNPTNNDTDLDGAPDGWEIQYSFDPLIDDSSLDADGDGLSNLEEYYHSTNPHLQDSDFDGFSDFWEVQFGFNPLNPEISLLEQILFYLTFIGPVIFLCILMVGAVAPIGYSGARVLGRYEDWYTKRRQKKQLELDSTRRLQEHKRIEQEKQEKPWIHEDIPAPDYIDSPLHIHSWIQVQRKEAAKLAQAGDLAGFVRVLTRALERMDGRMSDLTTLGPESSTTLRSNIEQDMVIATAKDGITDISKLIESTLEPCSESAQWRKEIWDKHHQQRLLAKQSRKAELKIIELREYAKSNNLSNIVSQTFALSKRLEESIIQGNKCIEEVDKNHSIALSAIELLKNTINSRNFPVRKLQIDALEEVLQQIKIMHLNGSISEPAINEVNHLVEKAELKLVMLQQDQEASRVRTALEGPLESFQSVFEYSQNNMYPIGKRMDVLTKAIEELMAFDAEALKVDDVLKIWNQYLKKGRKQLQNLSEILKSVGDVSSVFEGEVGRATEADLAIEGILIEAENCIKEHVSKGEREIVDIQDVAFVKGKLVTANALAEKWGLQERRKAIIEMLRQVESLLDGA